MEIWNFVLVGITGDLAKKKILPAISQFAEKKETEAQINLVGFSRSTPDNIEINKVLNQSTSDNKHKLKSIEFVQGNYDDSTFFHKIIGELKENQKIVIYLAVPPITYLGILNSLIGIKGKNIDVIIEKPFGQNLTEAKQLIELITQHELNSQVHFFDHYLYKNATIVSKMDKSNLKILDNIWPTEIKINLLEEEDVKNRAGYYSSIGCLKDMWPHSHNLARLIFRTLPLNTANLKISFTWQKVILGQYANFVSDLKVDHSDTNTFFKIVGSLIIDGHKIPITIVSGKKLTKKETSINLSFNEQTSLNWSIFPNPNLQFTSTENEFTINLEKNNNLDHTNLFIDILENNHEKFISTDEILDTWETFDQIISKWEKQKTQIQIYNSQNWQFLD